MSEELDAATLALIIRRMGESESARVQGNCRCCSAPLTGTYYDALRQDRPGHTDRRCQLCKLLGEQANPFQGEP